MRFVDIALLPKGTIRIRGKHVSFAVDPKEKIPSNAIFLLRKGNSFVASGEERLVVDGPGDYEVGGGKVTVFAQEDNLVYAIRLDGLEVLLAHGASLWRSQEAVADYHVVLALIDGSFDESVIPSLSPHVVALFGDKAKEAAKSLGKEVVSTRKFQTSVEKLPAEMQVVVLA